ncbi:MAG: hypothetical protein JO180_00255 [Gemmatirosa sp.]|nr:hypothetical protein [Gemmatirosa sp.]
MHPISTLGLVAALAVGAAAPAPVARHAARRTAPTPARTLVVTARNYAFDVPDTVAAGRTQIHLVNAGPELHHAALMRLKGGHTFADFLAATKNPGPPPAWVENAGGPNAPAPGASAETIVDLVPGTYVVMCFIPAPDGQPHFMKGMSRPFVVVPASRMPAAVHAARTGAPAATGAMTTVAAPDVTLGLTDYAFGFSHPVAAGHHVVHVTNGATQPHEVLFVRLAPGKTAADVAAFVEKNDMKAPPPGEPLGGTVALDPGVTNDVVLDLTPGRYAMLCFLPDAKDGKAHIAHGMMKDFTVR